MSSTDRLVLFGLGVFLGLLAAVVGCLQGQWTLAFLGLSQVVLWTLRARMTINAQRWLPRSTTTTKHAETRPDGRGDVDI